MKKFYAAAKNLNHPVKWIAGAFYCAMSVCIAILSGKKNCRIQYSASGGPWRSSNGSINWARKVCLGLLLIVGFTVFPGMHPAWTHDSGSHTAMAQPVLSTHCPHIRQWWQLWGNRENGNYRCPKGQSVRIRFSDDQLQTHTGRLYFEFKGKRNGSDDEYRVWVETVSANGSPLARYPLTLKTENGLSEGFLNVPGFGLDVSDAYLVIQYSPGSTGIPYGDFSY